MRPRSELLSLSRARPALRTFGARPRDRLGDKSGEEFPYFREFWIETPDPAAERIVLHALLDGESATGAFRFEIMPGLETSVDVGVTLFARRPVTALNMSPLSSMFFTGKNDHRMIDDFRTELHDLDGLLMHTGAGEWIWRPLSNPAMAAVSTFIDNNPRGFGLLQRDRSFEHYQDLELAYELRPAYWIEPREGWGEGGVQLVELPTDNETNDNIVASWNPKETLDTGRSMTYGYRVTALTNDARLTPGRVRSIRSAPRRAPSAPPTRPRRARPVSSSTFPAAISAITSATPRWSKSSPRPRPGASRARSWGPTRMCAASAPAWTSRSIPDRAATCACSCAPASRP